MRPPVIDGIEELDPAGRIEQLAQDSELDRALHIEELDGIEELDFLESGPNDRDSPVSSRTRRRPIAHKPRRGPHISTDAQSHSPARTTAPTPSYAPSKPDFSAWPVTARPAKPAPSTGRARRATPKLANRASPATADVQPSTSPAERPNPRDPVPRRSPPQLPPVRPEHESRQLPTHAASTSKTSNGLAALSRSMRPTVWYGTRGD